MSQYYLLREIQPTYMYLFSHLHVERWTCIYDSSSACHDQLNYVTFLLLLSMKPPELLTLLDELHAVRSKWYNFGLAMKLPSSTLDSIKSEETKNADRLRATLSERLKHPKFSWKVVVKALRKPMVGEYNIALELENKYCELPQLKTEQGS